VTEASRIGTSIFERSLKKMAKDTHSRIVSSEISPEYRNWAGQKCVDATVLKDNSTVGKSTILVNDRTHVSDQELLSRAIQDADHKDGIKK